MSGKRRPNAALKRERAIRNRLDKASPWPWRNDAGVLREVERIDPHRRPRGQDLSEEIIADGANMEGGGYSIEDKDLDLIANAPQDLDWLLKRRDAVRHLCALMTRQHHTDMVSVADVMRALDDLPIAPADGTVNA